MVYLQKKGIDLLDKFIFIQDLQYDYFCCVSFCYFESGIREELDIDLPIMAGVSVRGEMNVKFFILISYILAQALKARIIYDDAHILQQKNSYAISELEKLIKEYIQELYFGF